MSEQNPDNILDVDSTATDYLDKRDRALLGALRLQSIRAPLPMSVAVLVITALAFGKAPMITVIGWATAALLMQFVRYSLIHKWYRQTGGADRASLHKATLLSLANGLVVASSVLFFFPYYGSSSLAIHTMIMVGIMAGTIATSHGYRPVFFSFIVTNICALALGWLVNGPPDLSITHSVLIALLLLMLCAVLYRSASDISTAFNEIFLVNQKLEDALQAEKTAHASKTRFLAAASHDLRQPLHALSMLSAALNAKKLDEQSSDIANRIDSAVAALSSELDSLLDLSKLDAGVIEPQNEIINVHDALDSVLTTYQVQAIEKGLAFKSRFTAKPYLDIDRILFERLIRNLLDNAVKYTETGGIGVDITEQDDACFITIKDSGVGIPKSDHLKIREEFFQRHNPERDRNKGLGLGLSIVWRIAPLIGATIELDSAPDEGTVLKVRIPATNNRPPAIEDSTDSTTKSQKPNLKNTNVLMLEDDKAVRFSTRTVLESQGITVYEAICTNEATAIVRDLPLDIALIDLRLPGDDNGFTAVDEIRQLSPGMPIVLISGETTPDQIARARNMHCKLLVKPVRPQQLLDTIAKEIRPVGIL